LEVTLSLKDVVTGCTKSLRFFRDELCEECHGTGAKDGKTKTCERCHGTGVVENRQSTPFGVFITQTRVPRAMVQVQCLNKSVQCAMVLVWLKGREPWICRFHLA